MKYFIPQVDSIPAVFGVTRDPFIVFTSNLFAILGISCCLFLYELLGSYIVLFRKVYMYVLIVYLEVILSLKSSSELDVILSPWCFLMHD